MNMRDKDGLEPSIARFFEGLDENVPVSGTARALQAINARIDAPVVPKPSRVSYVPIFRFLAIAAAVVVVAIGLQYIPKIISTKKQPAPPTKTYSTTIGQSAKVQLAD